MSVQFTYPSAVELQLIEQQLLPTLTKDNPIFGIFPEINMDTPLLMWEQLDNFTGMMSVRGYDGKPPNVRAVDSKMYQMQPGVYGEQMSITEREITVSRELGTFTQPINVTRLVTQKGNQLLHRQLKRQAWIGWQLLANGNFTVTDSNGSLLHADSVTFRQYTPSIGWSSTATATPLANLRFIKTFARGYSINLGRGANAYCNLTTANNLMNNTNANDLGGKRRSSGSTFNSMGDINSIFLDNDLPTVTEWDGVWQDSAFANNLDIPDNTVIIKGARIDGAPIGNWVNTRNANNAGLAAGSYFKVIEPYQSVPPTVETHRGVNGGVALYYGSAIIIMHV